MNDKLSGVTAPRRFNVLIFAAFVVLAVFLAAVGVFGVMSHMVSQRTREIGIRIALGALRSNVLTMVIKEGAGVTLIGLALGLAGAVAFSRILPNMLFQVHPIDAVTYLIVSAILATVSLAACCFPAFRATRVDPMTALRFE